MTRLRDMLYTRRRKTAAIALLFGAVSAVGFAAGRIAADAEAQEAAQFAETPKGRYGAMLLEQFERTAFYAEFGGGNRAGRMIRWDGPVRVQLFGEPVTPRMEGIVRSHLAEMRILTGHDILLIGHGEGTGNVLLYGRTRDWMRRNGLGQSCRMLLDHDRRFHAVRARIDLAVDDPDMHLRHCIVEELTQAMGLTNDSTLFPNAILSDYGLAGRLEPEDEIMLELLYADELAPGMHIDDARPIAERLIRRRIDRGRGPLRLISD